MGKFTLFFFIVILVVLFYFAVLNKETVTFTLSPKTAYEMPKIALVLISSAVGASIMFLFFFLRDTKRFIDSRQYQRRQKRDLKIQELYAKALNAILADTRDEAQSALEGILQEEPNHVDALLRLGDIALADEDYQKALSYYRKAREIQLDNLELLFCLEKVMDRTGRTAEALMYLDEILKADPDNLSALYKKRAALEKKEQWDDLFPVQRMIIKCQHTDKVKEREQKNLLGYKYEQGRFSLENNALDKAEKAFRTVIRMEGNFVPAYIGLAEVFLRKGETEGAVNLLSKGLDLTSSPMLLARMEDLLINLGDPGRLITVYRNSVMKAPRNQALQFLMGKLYYRLEMVDDAFDTLIAVDDSSAPFPELHKLLGDIYLRRQQYAKALEEFKKVIDIEEPYLLPYCCSHCGSTYEDWAGRCSACKSWNTYQFNLHGKCEP